jgi:hypothetical protein
MIENIKTNKIKVFALGGSSINCLSNLSLNRSEFSKIVFSLNKRDSCSINTNSSDYENNFDFVFLRDSSDNNFNLENTLIDLNESFKNQLNIFLGFFNNLYLLDNNEEDTKEYIHFLNYLEKILQQATTKNSFSENKSINLCVIVMPHKLIYNNLMKKTNKTEKEIEEDLYSAVRERTKNADLTIYIDDYNRINNIEIDVLDDLDKQTLPIDQFYKKVNDYLSKLFESKEKVFNLIKNKEELQVILK